MFFPQSPVHRMHPRELTFSSKSVKSLFYYNKMKENILFNLDACQ